MSSERSDVVSMGRTVTDETGDDASDAADALDHLGDEVSRTILAACSADARSVGELATLCEVSEATIYRRLNKLMDAGLLDERTRIDTRSVSGGKEYTTAVSNVDVSFDENGLTVRTTARDDDQPLPTFTVVEPAEDSDEQVVDLQLRLPETLFSEFLTVWAELNERTATDDVELHTDD
ncbi:winged helix-turn-helix domain-containing protein [Halomarina rubra]|uniref:Winged helix-turn-helix domain-containing protein n=1 Tax=Halomarina rubra TaxID=2071873 RepID=A0ABD6B2C8_9EURY|nr:winged helix-turn-helix domain-containing protein [Halomarina rubra]